MTDLYDSASIGNLKRVILLVEQGLDKNQIGRLRKETALCRAAGNNHLVVVRYLVEQGADMEKEDRDGWTPLMCGYLEVTRYLLEQGANRDKASNHRITSLHWAAKRRHLEIAKLLMVYGADLNARTEDSQLPIDMPGATEEIRQAILDEPRRRLDEAPGKRATEQDRHPNAAATSASAQQDDDEEGQDNIKQPAVADGVVADEDQDSEPSSDEDEN